MMKKALPSPGQQKVVAATKPKKEWFKVMRASEVRKREMEWLWQGYLPLGMITLLTGDPQAGKSTLILDLAARLSRGDPLPGETESRTPMRTWIMSSEDAMDTVIVWRLENQGADMSQIIITDERAKIEKLGVQEFERIITENRISLCVIDTTTTWMGGDLDTNKGNDVMGWINPIKEVATRTRCTIVLIRHRRKGSANDNKLHAGLGSIAWTAAVRSELTATYKKGARFVERTKGNIGQPPPILAYTINPHPDPENIHGVLTWLGEFADETGEATPQVVSKTPKKIAECRAWLRILLRQGSVLATEVLSLAADEGYSESTLKRAKIGVATSYNDGQGKWFWALEKGVKTDVMDNGDEYIVCHD